jgi:hypothetical protein
MSRSLRPTRSTTNLPNFVEKSSVIYTICKISLLISYGLVVLVAQKKRTKFSSVKKTNLFLHLVLCPTQNRSLVAVFSVQKSLGTLKTRHT